jgi:hypothetical protein
VSRFAPVHLSKPLDRRVSQTMLRHFNSCHRSGFLYAETKGAVQTVEMVRGSVCHAIYERATNLMIEQGEPVLPPELIKVIANEVLAEYPLPIEEHDLVREQGYRWASEWAIDPVGVVATETLFVLDLGGWQVRCKVDYAELRAEGLQVYVADYKTGLGAPPYDDIARKRPDKTIAAKNFQLILYALAVVFGLPVRVEPCAHVFDDKTLDGDPLVFDCMVCHNRGYIETVEPFPVAPRAQEVIAEFVYPAIEDSKGRMLRRTMGLTRLELEEYRESMLAIVQQLQHAEESGDWPAVVSDIACDQCPAKMLCPIPPELRDRRGEINTMEELQEACERYYVEGKQREALRKEIRATAKALGGPRARVRFGKDRVWELGDLKESLTIADKDGMWAAVERAVNEGVPFERSEFEKVGKTTPFAERTLSEDELAEESDQLQEVSSGGQ